MHQPPATPPRFDRLGLACLSLCILLSSLGTSIANVALPTFVATFDASFQQAQWIVLSYLLAITTAIVGAGRLGDLVGRRRLLLAGILVFAGSSAWCGLAPSLIQLVAARAAQGVGAAMMLALAMASVGDAVPKERTGRAMGLLGAMSALGSGLGPSLGGILISTCGWPAIFFINIPLGLGAFVLARRVLPPDHATSPAIGARTPAPFDLRGAALLALAVFLFALALTFGSGRFGSLNAALLLASCLSLFLFVGSQARAPAPLIPPILLREPALRASFAANALVTTVLMASLVVGPFYLSSSFGLDPARVGLAMSTGPIFAVFVSALGGPSSDRFGAPRVTAWSLALMALGCSLMFALPRSLGLLGYILPLLAITSGYVLFQAANNAAAMTSIAPDQRGVVSGLLNLSRNLGFIAGVSVMGAVFDLSSGANDLAASSAADIATGMRATFRVGAGLALLALAITLRGNAHAKRAPLGASGASSLPPPPGAG